MKTQHLRLKHAFIVCILFLGTLQLQGQTADKPSGKGSKADPYNIKTLEHLYWVSQTDSVWDRHFVQTADIDATPTKGWDNDSGFTPIGNEDIKFTGTYNGKGHIIKGLFVNRPEKIRIGLIGYAIGDSVHIDSLGMTGVDLSGYYSIGAVAGIIEESVTVSSCYSTGKIAGKLILGGLIGRVEKRNCNVKNCYSSCVIKKAEDKFSGGLVGLCREGQIKNSYSNGKVDGDNGLTGGLVGDSYSNPAKNSFWDIETSQQTESDEGIGLTTAEMTTDTTYLNNGWDFVGADSNGTQDIWDMHPDINDGYPFLSWQYPFPSKDELTTITGKCSVAVTEKPTALGTSGKQIEATTKDPLEYSEPGTYTITWKYEDSAGNTDKQQQKVIVEDKEKPTISCPGNQEVKLEADDSVYTVSGTNYDPAEVNDNCSVEYLENDFNQDTSLAGAEFGEGTTEITWTVKDKADNTASCSFEVSVTIEAETTGITALEQAGLRIFPNPVEKNFKIVASKEKLQRVTILDLTGKKHIDRPVNNQKAEFDLAGLPVGIYLVRIQTSQGQFSSKLIKR
jgi:hypothetical protein